MAKYKHFESFDKSRLTNAEFATFISATLDRLATPVGEKTGVKADADRMRPLLAQLEDIVRRMMAAAETQTLDELDAKRDEIVNYILSTIRNESHSIADGRRQAALKLIPIADLYKGVGRLRDTDETATIRGMLIDLRKAGMPEALNAIGLGGVPEALEQVNNQYVATSEARRRNIADSSLGAAKPLRREMEDIYGDITDRIFAVSVVTPEVTEAARFIELQNQAVAEMRHTLAQRLAKPKKKGADPDAGIVGME